MSLLYKPVPVDYVKGKMALWNEINENNWAQLNELDQIAKDKGQMVGRHIYEGVADGYAIYQIIKENKKTVRIKVCRHIGDDWVIHYWGEETIIDKEYAKNILHQRDNSTFGPGILEGSKAEDWRVFKEKMEEMV